MADPQVLNTLRTRADAIRSAIIKYEAKIAEAQRDLSHLNATIRLFEIGDDPLQFPVHMDLTRLFKRREIGNICKAALAEHGPLTTRELALHVIRAKGMDEGDKVLRQTISYRIVQSMRLLWKRGGIDSEGKRDGVRVWSY